MKLLGLIPLYLILMLGCEDSSSQRLNVGTYSGEYKVFNNIGTSEENFTSGETELTIDLNGYHLTENTYITPPFSAGQCSWTETTITFQDTVVHTAEFDWTLIIGGTYTYIYDAENNRKYSYRLER